MTLPESRPTHFLVFLLAGVLLLSLGLNAFLLYGRAEPYPENEDLATSITELRMTQRLLARCQSSQHQQDSVLAVLHATHPSRSSALAEQ